MPLRIQFDGLASPTSVMLRRLSNFGMYQRDYSLFSVLLLKLSELIQDILVLILKARGRLILFIVVTSGN